MPSIADSALPVALLVAALAGLVSFASPCVLPLVPGFLGYVTGLQADPRRSRTVLGAALFVTGFTAVFVALLVSASGAASLLREHQSALTKAGGVLVIAMGLVFLGIGDRFGSQGTVTLSWRPAAGLAGAPLLGAVFALGWAPCTGPTLSAIVALTAPLSSADGGAVGRGVALAIAYSMGLGVPFLLLAAGWSRAGRASAWLRRHRRGVQLFGGIVLIVVGLLLLTGWWQSMIMWVQTRLVSSFETVI